MTSELAELVRQVKLTNALLRMVHQDRLAGVAGQIKADPINKIVIEYLDTHGDVPSAVLKEAVAGQIPAGSMRTVGRRIAELENLGVIERSGAGNATRYALSGVVV